MSSAQYRIVLRHNFIIDVIEDILSNNSNKHTTIIICSTQEDFLHQLLGCVDAHDEQAPALDDTEIPASQEDLEDDAQAEEQRRTDVEDRNRVLRIFSPTLHMLKTSRNVHVAFCPTITTFRAYLSVFQPSSTPAITAQDEQADCSRLVIVDLMALHHGTSEFSLQGLSRTFAKIASTAYQLDLQLELVECKNVLDPTDPNHGAVLWDAKVPLLSASVKINAAGAAWAGRTIEVKKLAQRWFKFE